MAEAVILAGLQGSGKTTYFNQHYAHTHVHVSRDIQGSREAALIADCVKNGKSFAVDDTNLTRAARAPLIAAAKDAGFRVIGLYFEVTVRTAIGRNNYRKDKKPIPVPAILRAAKQLEKPSMEEGFDEVRTIPEK